MLIVKELSEIPPFDQKCALTIGSFDGVHLGHQKLIQSLKKKVSPEGALAVLSFANHPSMVLKNRPPALQICTQAHKFSLLEKQGVDLLILLSFTPELASQSYEHFLTSVRNHFPFSFLSLGKGASLGKNKEGNEERLKALGNTLGYEAEYIDKLIIDNEMVSSDAIRKLITSGDLKKASTFLGRPYSILGKFENGMMKLEGLCLPPAGEYLVEVVFEGHRLSKKGLINRSPSRLEIADIANDLPTAEVIF